MAARYQVGGSYRCSHKNEGDLDWGRDQWKWREMSGSESYRGGRIYGT